MKVQSTKPQIPTQVPQSIEDTQLDGEFTEAFSELIATLNAGADTESEFGMEMLEAANLQASKEDNETETDNDDLQNTMDSILFGLHIPVVSEMPKQIEQQQPAADKNNEVDKVELSKPGIPLNTGVEQASAKEALELTALTKGNEMLEKPAENMPNKLAIKDKPANTEAVSPVKVAMSEIDTQTMNAVKHANMSVTPISRATLQLDPNALLQDKPSAALQELSRFINQHTTAAMTEVKPVAPTAPQPTISYTQTLDKLNQLEPGMIINKSSVGTGLAMKDVYTANIKIHPPELGEVMATLKVDKNNAQLVLFTENEHVKSILQAHVAQLKDNFQKSDLYLTNVDVQTSNGDAEKQHKQPDSKQLPHANQQVKNEEAKPEAAKTVSERINSLIDTYV